MNFSLDLYPSPIYGELLPNESWNGAMGMVHSGKVQMSISDFSITQLRSQYVDFALGIYQQVPVYKIISCFSYLLDLSN